MEEKKKSLWRWEICKKKKEKKGGEEEEEECEGGR